MSQKTYIPSGEMPPSSQIGATFEALAATIAARREAGEETFLCNSRKHTKVHK